MFKSKPLQAAYDKAWEYAKDLTAHEEGFSHHVLIMHEEGSVLSVDSAFLVEFEAGGEFWIAMVAEHQDLQVWAEDDLTFYAEFGPRVRPRSI